MKKAKYLFFTVIISLTTLSVLGENNFGSGFGFNFGEDEPKISQKEVQDEVRVQLVDRLTKCYFVGHPEKMMMKCSAYIKFEFARDTERFLKEDTKFYSTQNIYADLVLNDCGQESHLASLRINFNMPDKVMVQESFFTEWVTAAQFVNDFCEKMKDAAPKE